MMPSRDQVQVVSEASIMVNSFLHNHWATWPVIGSPLLPHLKKTWFLATLWGFLCWCLGFCYIVMADPYVIWTKWAMVGPVAIWCISAWEDVVYLYTLHLSRVWFILSFSPQLQFKVWATFINATLPCCLIFLYWVDFVFINLKFTGSTITPASVILMLFSISNHHSAYHSFFPVEQSEAHFYFKVCFDLTSTCLTAERCCTDPEVSACDSFSMF